MSVRSTVLLMLFASGFGSSARCQSPGEEAFLESLRSRDKASATLESLLEDSEHFSTMVLFVGSTVAQQAERQEDAAFLFYCAKLRARFDRVCFPPAGKGSEDPFVLFSAMSSQIGAKINPSIMAKPRKFAKAVERLSKWRPKTDAGYLPGYRFEKRLMHAEAERLTHARQKQYVEGLAGLSTLLNHDEYFAAFRTFQKEHLRDMSRVFRERERVDDSHSYAQAVETMERIETALEIRGFAYRHSRSRSN